MNTEQKIERRGGKRPGAGRKPETLSANQVARMLRRARKWAKSKGKTIDDVLFAFIYSDQERTADRIACIKLFKELTTAKITEGGETDKALGPAFFLPEKHPRLTLVEGGKSE